MTDQPPPLPPPPPPGQPQQPQWAAPPPPYSPAPGQPYYDARYGWVQPSTTNGLAIASLVLSLLWFAGLGSILAIVFGHIARRQIRARPEKGKGLSLAGLIIGYLGLVGAIAFFVGLAVLWNNPGIRNSLVRGDVRDAARAEELNLIDNHTYTNLRSDLDGDGFQGTFPGDTVLAAYNGRIGFCVIGSRNGASDWFLYDSRKQVGVTGAYPTELAAEQACTVPGVGGYADIS